MVERISVARGWIVNNRRCRRWTHRIGVLDVHVVGPAGGSFVVDEEGWGSMRCDVLRSGTWRVGGKDGVVVKVEGEVNQASDGRLRIVTRSWQVSLLVAVTSRRLGGFEVVKTVGCRSKARKEEDVTVVDVALRS